MRLWVHFPDAVVSYDNSMNTLPDTSRLPFDRPAIYLISVEGRIPSDWLDRLDGMRANVIDGIAAQVVTTLTGELADQAALAGVLKTIYELHLSVLSVTRLDG